MMTYVFGAPGCGKTPYCASLVKKCTSKKSYKKRYPNGVFTNFPCEGAHLLDSADVGMYQLDHCLIILDESGVDFNNRDFKKGLLSDKGRLDFYKKHRHYHTDIVIVSQGWDEVDKKLRTLCVQYYMLKRSLLPFFTRVKRVIKKCDIDEKTHEPCDFFSFDVFGTSFLFRPRYYRMFDSFECTPLPVKEFPVVDKSEK